jgi:hypothetical protein
VQPQRDLPSLLPEAFQLDQVDAFFRILQPLLILCLPGIPVGQQMPDLRWNRSGTVLLDDDRPVTVLNLAAAIRPFLQDPGLESGEQAAGRVKAGVVVVVKAKLTRQGRFRGAAVGNPFQLLLCQMPFAAPFLQRLLPISKCSTGSGRQVDRA